MPGRRAPRGPLFCETPRCLAKSHSIIFWDTPAPGRGQRPTHPVILGTPGRRQGQIATRDLCRACV